MSDKVVSGAATAEKIRKQAEAEFAERNPRPTLPPPPKPTRPGVIRADEAHVWVDVKAVDRWNLKPKATFYVVERRDRNVDQRIEGELTPEAIDALIEELQRAKAELQLRAVVAEQSAKLDEDVKAWESERDIYARAAVTEWQKGQAAKSK